MRLFAALELPERSRRVLAAAAAQGARTVSNVRWAAPETMHVTLRFLGEVDESRLDDLRQALAPVFARHPIPRLGVAGVGAFPEHGSVRVVRAGLEMDPDLAALAAAVSAACEGALDLSREGRPFRPHVTLGRLREPMARALFDRLAAGLGEVASAPEAVPRGTLYSSRPGPQGAKHSKVAEFPFAGAAA